MKRIFMLFAFALMVFGANAQVFKSEGTFNVVNPKCGSQIKDCAVYVYEGYAIVEMCGTESVVSVVSSRRTNAGSFCGDIFYLSEDHMSYVFYGENEDKSVCLVSLQGNGDRWLLSKLKYKKPIKIK